MCPSLELLAVHPELAAGNLAHLLVDSPQLELPNLKTHGGAAVAAAPGLMEHDGPVLALQFFDELARGLGHAHAIGFRKSQALSRYS